MRDHVLAQVHSSMSWQYQIRFCMARLASQRHVYTQVCSDDGHAWSWICACATWSSKYPYVSQFVFGQEHINRLGLLRNVLVPYSSQARLQLNQINVSYRVNF